MKYFILFSIRLYWVVIPKQKRKKCLFKKSCSNYVFEQTLNEGFFIGLKAFWFRYKNCRSGYQIFINPVTNETQMLLPSKVIINKEEITDRFLTIK